MTNTVLTPEQTKTKEQLISEILLLAVTTHYHTDRCVFADFSGHVDRLNISVRENKKDYSNTLANSEIYLKPYSFLTTDEEIEKFERDLLEQLQHIKAKLESFIEKGSIQLEDFTPVVTYTI